MKATYSAASPEVPQILTKLIDTFRDKFDHIAVSQLCLMFKDSQKSTWEIRSRVFNGLYRTLTNKKILIEIHKQNWELASNEHKVTLLYRELLRIQYNEKKQDYVLRKPDVQDFKEILEKLGLNYEKSGEFFKPILS